MKGGTMRRWLRVGIIIASALAVLTSTAHAQGSYPEPPTTNRTLPITDQTIAQAMTTANPLSDFLRLNQNRYTLFPRATIDPPGGWTVVWPDVAYNSSEKYIVSWSKVGARFWAVDCVTQKVVQLIGTINADLNCSRFAVMADKEVEIYFLYR